MGIFISGSRPWPFCVTWRHRSHDQSIRHMLFPIGVHYKLYFAMAASNTKFVTEPPSLTIFEIFASIYIWVTTLNFLGHVTSSVTWSFDSPGAISYRCSIVTKSLSPTIFEIMGIFSSWVTILTFLGHVTSPVTWPIDTPYVISYWCPIVTKPLSLTIFEIFGPNARARTHTETLTNFKWPYLRNRSSNPLHVWFYGGVFGDGGSNGAISGLNKHKMVVAAIQIAISAQRVVRYASCFALKFTPFMLLSLV